jgi:N-acetylmuramoyl-L-alanine amidase
MIKSLNICTDLVSPNFDKRSKKIDTIVIHSTHMTFADSSKRLCDPTARVSCHYLIDLSGKLYQLVEDEKRAWHAGKSYWRGKTSLNNNSIGIELVDTDNKGTRLSHFPKPQMISLIELLKFLIKKYKIPSYNLVAHSDIAPDRKDDPGEHFDWALLASHKLGQYHKLSTTHTSNPEKATILKVKELQRLLKKQGYKIKITGKLDTQTTEVLTAFRRRFNPKDLNKDYISRIDFKILLELSSTINSSLRAQRGNPSKA